MSTGRLRVFLGAAPGVGKTYAMLEEGHRLRALGRDVVIAYVEPHARTDTIAMIGDLEIVPRRTMEYRGSTFEEMDLDAVLRRAPQVALVDELAHTNIPGSPNAKRWQDVEAMLEAGIDVMSTLNIQHLESLNDVVFEITDIVQRETIPDEVVRRASEIELVDLTQEGIRERMASGKIYPAERIDAALGNYFRPGNLGALRELALSWTAERVDEAVAKYRSLHGIDSQWETKERVVVAMAGAVGGDDIVRRAARLAMRSRADLLGVFVRPTDGLTDDTSLALAAQIQLLQSLGGRYHEVVGDDVASSLIAFAKGENATQLVLGATRRSRFQELMGGSPVARVVRKAGDIDIHVISYEGARPRRFRPRSRQLLSPASAHLGVGRRHPGAAADHLGAPHLVRRPAPQRPSRLSPGGGRSRRPRWRPSRRGHSHLRVLPRQLVLHASGQVVDHQQRRQPLLPLRLPLRLAGRGTPGRDSRADAPPRRGGPGPRPRRWLPPRSEVTRLRHRRTRPGASDQGDLRAGGGQCPEARRGFVGDPGLGRRRRPRPARQGERDHRSDRGRGAW